MSGSRYGRPVLNGNGGPPIAPPNAPILVDPAELTLTERILVTATPVVTLVGLIGLGYPPYAALTRYRVAHQPKTSPNKTSYWQVLKGIKERDGVKGLYKGLLLNLSVGVAPWLTVVGGYAVLRAFPKSAPYLLVGGIAQLGWQAVTTLVTLPFEILAVRALSTPHSIPIVSPMDNLRILFTAEERAHPIRAIYTPSRFWASFIPTLIAPLSAAYLLPQFLKLGQTEGLMAFLATQIILAVGLRTPLAVLAARLNAQRLGGTGAAIEHRKGDEAPGLEGIVQVRPMPYKNIIDAAQTIVREEGWAALWRGWPLEAMLAFRNYA